MASLRRNQTWRQRRHPDIMIYTKVSPYLLRSGQEKCGKNDFFSSYMFCIQLSGGTKCTGIPALRCNISLLAAMSRLWKNETCREWPNELTPRPRILYYYYVVLYFLYKTAERTILRIGIYDYKEVDERWFWNLTSTFSFILLLL